MIGTTNGLPENLQDSLSTLLSTWCEGLLRHQIYQPGDIELHGGLLCPDCGFVHGRCGDALYPLLKMARQSGEGKWIEAAVAVQNGRTGFPRTTARL